MEGGEIVTPSSSYEETIQHQFDAFAKKNLKGEAKSLFRELYKRKNNEICFSEMNEAELNELYCYDEYDLAQYTFKVLGYDIKIKDDLLGEALELLPEKKRDIVLMSYYLELSDAEIGKVLNIVRSTVFRHRKTALSKIKKYMEGNKTDDKS